MPIVPANIPRPQQNRTEVGVRGLNQSSQPGTLEKKGRKGRAKKAKGNDSSALDRVSREDENLLVDQVGDEPRRRGHADPAEDGVLEAVPGHAGTMVRRAGRAFRIDEFGQRIPPHYADVEQGNLQDAWLLASLAAVAHAQPEVLVKRLRTEREGDFSVKLGRHRFDVAPEFPSEGYAEPEPRGFHDTLWVALYEKAFALAFACSYAHLELGHPGWALSRLVEGRVIRRRLTAQRDPAAELERLAAWSRGGHPMTLVSRPQAAASPFVADHAYAVVGVEGDRVTVYNPWGTRRGSRELDSVRHTLPWAEVRAAAEYLYVGGVI